MINPSLVTTTTTYNTAPSVSTFNGDISLEQARGRLVVYDPVTHRELNVVDKDGYLFYDSTDSRILIGRAPNDDIGMWISKPGSDVIEELGG